MKWKKGTEWIKEHLEDVFDDFDVPPPCRTCSNLYIGVVSEEWSINKKRMEILLLRDEAHFTVGCNADPEGVADDFDECIEGGTTDPENYWTKTPFIYCHETGEPHICTPRWLAIRNVRVSPKEATE